MSRAAQQRIIEDLQGKNRVLKDQLASAKAQNRLYDDLTEVLDAWEHAGLKEVPISVLRQIRPPGHGLK